MVAELPEDFQGAMLGRLDEDLSGNLARVSEIARRNCNGCADYHVGYVARRLTKDRAGRTSNRDAFVRFAATHLKAFSTSQEPLQILIAGAADSGLPAIAAMAADAAGPDILERLRMTVVDRCATPLELSKIYGERAQIPIEVACADLVASKMDIPADLIFVQSLFHHIAEEHHVSILKRMARCLKPAGMIMFSTSVGGKSKEFQLKQRLDEEEAILRLITEEGISPSEPVGELMARAERERSANHHVRPYATVDALNGLFASAGLAVLAQQTNERRSGLSGFRVFSVLVNHPVQTN